MPIPISSGEIMPHMNERYARTVEAAFERDNHIDMSRLRKVGCIETNAETICLSGLKEVYRWIIAPKAEELIFSNLKIVNGDIFVPEAKNLSLGRLKECLDIDARCINFLNLPKARKIHGHIDARSAEIINAPHADVNTIYALRAEKVNVLNVKHLFCNPYTRINGRVSEIICNNALSVADNLKGLTFLDIASIMLEYSHKISQR
jgi:hypothetical protein